MNVVAITPERDNYIIPVAQFLDYPLVFLRTPEWAKLEALNPVAVIFLGDWLFEQSKIIQTCRENGIPSILMMDGTIEWKHFFENPKWSYGGNEAPYFPVLCDKIFVPGESTYRFLNFFGNSEKCEITGFPRFDSYFGIKLDHSDRKKKVIGIMSGNTAGYTHIQISQSKQLFEDIFSWADSQEEIDVKWRLRKGFNKLLDVHVQNDDSGSLLDFLKKVDAVICQPSTAAYEAMLLGLPVALADYSIAPNYMHSAWEIHSKSHISEVIQDITDAPLLKMALQKQLLEDTIAYFGISSAISAAVINEMIKISLSKKLADIHYPTSMASVMAKSFEFGNSIVEMPLFRRRTAYKFNNLALLQENYSKLECEKARLEFKLKRRTLGFWFERFVNKFEK